MKLHYSSDLHLEFSNQSVDTATDAAGVIVLAGDIWQKGHGIHWARATWPDKEIVYVAGNHEFYGSSRASVLAELRIAAKETGVHFLDNEEVVIGGPRFLGCTLWTDFRLFGDELKEHCQQVALHGLNDFVQIKDGDAVFTPQDAERLHLESIAFLTEKLKTKHDGKTVVVTHHLPSMKSIPRLYTSDHLSACYASNLEELAARADLWIHGHTHVSQDYEVVGTTHGGVINRRGRVVSNPRGYCHTPGMNENWEFDAGLLIDLEERYEAVMTRLIDGLNEQFPRMFKLGRSFECGDGWYPLLKRLCVDLEKIMDEHNVPEDQRPWAAQVKEKFGGLRFYLNYPGTECSEPGPEERPAWWKLIQERIEWACEESERTCESCCRPGTMRHTGWVHCYCDKCEADRMKELEE